jgi:GTPase SAR1 family protein
VPGSNGESSDSVDENIQITLWDFCDHPEADADRQSYEPMHRGMHRLFMTNTRTLYLITTDLSKFNATEMDYWVQNVHEYAPGAPVIIVGTHQDQVTSQRVSGTCRCEILSFQLVY